jgi:two-component system chemotaxis sensor kinase CheA
MVARAESDVDQDFNAITLDQLDVDDETKQPVVTTNVGRAEDHLLNKLENAFDAKLGGKRFKEQVKLSVDIERILLSDDMPTQPQSPAEDKAFELTQRNVPDDGQGVESLLFSGLETTKRGRSLPPSVSKRSSSPQPAASDQQDLDEHRGRYNLGRRQSDKIRERMIKQSIRVDAIKIDNLMNQVGELVVSRSGFSQLFTEMRELQLLLKQSMKLNPAEMQKIKDLTNRINEATVSLGRVTSELQENVMKVRMLPIAQLFSRYPRLVHDLVKGSQKKVSLEIHGEDTELDKMVIEQIADPLVHIIRNAVDHGIEDVGERLQKGKSEEGMLRLEAYHESNFVVIEISDDGRGMDPEQIKAEALAKSFVDEEEVDGLNEQELLALIMRPGFSTASEVTHTSGRGVGMDVVKDNIEKLNGTIDIVSTIGAGVTFRIKIPLTLAIIPALLVRVQSELFTIPLPTVDETLRIKRDEISTIEGMEVYYLRENTVPLIRLAELFSMRQAAADPEELFVVIINTGARQVGLIVDELRAREEVVIKPLEDYLQEKSGFSGATILGDGSISLILDVYELVQLALGRYAIRSSTATA